MYEDSSRQFRGCRTSGAKCALLSSFLALTLLFLAPDAQAAATLNIGETSILANADNGNANLLVAQNATLSQGATIQSLSFYVTTASGNLRLGIYDATGPGGGPGTKKAETNSITPVAGWNTASVITPVALPAGSYWLAYLPSANLLAFQKNSTAGTSGVFYSYTYGAMPAIFSTTPSSTASHWSFYATLNLSASAPAASISPAALNFGSQAVGTPSALQTVTVTNTGTASLTFAAGALSGDFAWRNGYVQHGHTSR